ncbi:hypothetical protein SASPL_129129 [Salvia splendens]|uniref:cytokinin dehydrogenase n=1 Tax=Salvia splendens TaxID=180675 RepID=A0A8X8XCJ7_SALSN|nr:hypothetical protein SASPL_129129 [Salvia splendens]
MRFDGNLSFENIHHASRDFGNRFHLMPTAVLYPKSISNIAQIIKHVFNLGLTSHLTVAARCQRRGRGDVVTCSDEQNADLFNAALGGLGQFGIITEARIALEPAPTKVKWIRVLYSDFVAFTNDQERLISHSRDAFDYLEGFVVINRTGLLNNWRSSFNPRDPVQAEQFTSEGKILFCLELAKYFNVEEVGEIEREVDSLLAELSYIRSTLFLSEVSYVDFLDRVHVSEMKLRENDLWDVPHPWLNLLVPKSSIHGFAEEVFHNIVKDTSNGPVLIYPVNKSRWKNGTSLVTPDEDVFYLVAFLSSAMPSSVGRDSMDALLERNSRIVKFVGDSKLGIKQYLPHYTTTQEWRAHFGDKWEVFLRRKNGVRPPRHPGPWAEDFSEGQHLGTTVKKEREKTVKNVNKRDK